MAYEIFKMTTMMKNWPLKILIWSFFKNRISLKWLWLTFESIYPKNSWFLKKIAVDKKRPRWDSPRNVFQNIILISLLNQGSSGGRRPRRPAEAGPEWPICDKSYVQATDILTISDVFWRKLFKNITFDLNGSIQY